MIYTWFNISVGIRPEVAFASTLLILTKFSIHQRFFLRLVIWALAVTSTAHSHSRILTSSSMFSRTFPSLVCVGTAFDLELMHCFEGLRHSYHQFHQFLLWKICVVDQIRIDRILEVTSLVVWK